MTGATMQVEFSSETSPYGHLDIKSPALTVSEVQTPAPISVDSQCAEPRLASPEQQETPPTTIDVTKDEVGNVQNTAIAAAALEGSKVDIDNVNANSVHIEPQLASSAQQEIPVDAVNGTKVEVDNVNVNSTHHAESVEATQSISRVDESIPPPPKTVSEKTEMILDVLERYRMSTTKGTHKTWTGRSKVFEQVKQHLESQTVIRMILPAFPFKSPNKTGKVLGDLPDAAEEVALQHLQGLCVMIEEIHSTGAEFYIVSDGLMYSDLLEISDLEVWRYGQALRQLAVHLGCNKVKFMRLADLLGREYSEPLTEETYLRDAPGFRQELLDKNLPTGFDASTFVASDPDATLTYRGYIKFLEKDLENSPLAKSADSKKRYHEGVAKAMITRGKAFAAAVAKRFHDFIRLSIHASTSDASKLSVSLVPQEGACAMTPWHSVLVRGVDGSITMSHALRVPALTHDLITENGRPVYFREKSDLFSWPGMDVKFEYLYPTGILIKSQDPAARYSLHNVHMKKVRGLAEKCSPVILRGFADTTDRHTFIAKSYDAGEVLPWTFGVLQEVKDAGRKDRMANNVVSSEAMPMHYDGMFKFAKKVDPDTKEETTVSCPPRFQYFTAKTPSPRGSGYTLFASSRLFFQHLPPGYTEDKISKLTWDCKNSGFWDNHMVKQPLVVPHPTSGQPCVRWHEPWPQWKTKFAHCIVNIENGPQKYKQLVDQMLYDRRVCLYWTWEQGDVLVNDNFNMLHTRSAFDGETDRELWRIHFD